MKILLTGGTGWLGRKVLTRMCQEGYDVCVLCRPTSQIESLGGLTRRYVLLKNGCEEEIKKFSPDLIVHMACIYDRKGTLLDDIIEANFRMPSWLLRIATEIQCKNFYAIGSNLQQNLNWYTFTKSMLSDLGRMAVERNLISFTEILPEAFYDIDEPENRFLPRCISKMRKNEKVLLPEGHRHRDYMWAGDLVDMISFLLKQDLRPVAEYMNGEHTYAKIQVGSGEAPSVRSFMEYIKTLLHSTSEMCYGGIPPRPNEPDSVADLTNLKRLGYSIEKIIPWTSGIYNLVNEK